MSIFETLTREHRVMRGLTAKVERAFRLDEGDAARRGLLVLCRALSLHEDIEDLLVEPAGPNTPPELADALSLVERQHAEIVSLIDEALELIRRGRGDEAARLKVLALVLARLLRAHFQTEEVRLWPVLAFRTSRSVERSLARRAEQGVADLEKEVFELGRASAGRSLGRRAP